MAAGKYKELDELQEGCNELLKSLHGVRWATANVRGWHSQCSPTEPCEGVTLSQPSI